MFYLGLSSSLQGSLHKLLAVWAEGFVVEVNLNSIVIGIGLLVVVLDKNVKSEDVD